VGARIKRRRTCFIPIFSMGIRSGTEKVCFNVERALRN
jgi:hypothetical protein